MTISIIIISVNLLGFLTVMWVLSGLFDIPLVGQFLAAGFHIGLISTALWSFSGFPLDPWTTQLGLAIEDFERIRAHLSVMIRAVALLGVFVYIPISAVFYFRLYLSTELLMVSFLKIVFVVQGTARWNLQAGSQSTSSSPVS